MDFCKVMFFTHNDTMLVVMKNSDQLSSNESDAGTWPTTEATEILRRWSQALGISGKDAKLICCGDLADLLEYLLDQV